MWQSQLKNFIELAQLNFKKLLWIEFFCESIFSAHEPKVQVRLSDIIKCPSVIHFSYFQSPKGETGGLLLVMLSYIWMKEGSKLLYENLQIKFDFCHRQPSFSWFIVLCSKLVFAGHIGFPDFSLLCFHIPGWKLTGRKYSMSSRKLDFFLSFLQ